MKKLPKRSPIALAILAMLFECPMHPYRMQQLIKERGKDAVINVEQRASLYQTIIRLERDQLIEKHDVRRDEKRPERTEYRLTAAGRAIALEWMRQILATPGEEFPEFPAAVSFIALLTPDDACVQLEHRLKGLSEDIARIDAEVAGAGALPRLFLLEMELLRTVRLAERDWVMSVVADLRAQRLTWSEEWIRQVAAEFAPPSSGAKKPKE